MEYLLCQRALSQTQKREQLFISLAQDSWILIIVDAISWECHEILIPKGIDENAWLWERNLI